MPGTRLARVVMAAVAVIVILGLVLGSLGSGT
jgi:hypothetical protein